MLARLLQFGRWQKQLVLGAQRNRAVAAHVAQHVHEVLLLLLWVLRWLWETAHRLQHLYLLEDMHHIHYIWVNRILQPCLWSSHLVVRLLHVVRLANTIFGYFSGAPLISRDVIIDLLLRRLTDGDEVLAA